MDLLFKFGDLIKRNKMQLILSALCLTLTTLVIGNAYQQKKQFYPAVLYITKSNSSMGVIYAQFFVIVFLLGKLFRKIFLGTLRPAEFEHLLDRFWYALTETCLAFTVFRDDFTPRFIALFTLLLFLKSFHWLVEERVDFMERSPILGVLFHIRVVSLLCLLGLFDYQSFMYAYEGSTLKGPNVQLVFGFEYAILLTMVVSTFMKYVLHTAEMRTQTQWENKAMFLLYTELVIGFVKVMLYLLFVVIMARIYALPMFVLRPMFFTIRNFRKALTDVIMSRRAIRNMNTLYPEATEEELRLSDNICIICRDDMVGHAKKLPCGHIFHTLCLRSWFQRQQTCPTCRMNILRVAGQRPPTAGQIPVGGTQTGNTNLRAQAAQGVGNATTATQMLPNPNNIFQNGNFPALPILPQFIAPQFPFMAPFTNPPPAIPADLTNFSDEELKIMEQNNRKAIEERLKLLRNVQSLLDAASALMINYQTVSAHIESDTHISSTTGSTADDVPSSSNAVNNATTNPTTNQVPESTAISDADGVTIEDLGVDEDEPSQVDSVTDKRLVTSSDNSKLFELRQRRVKFWEDKVKSKNSLKSSSSETPSSS